MRIFRLFLGVRGRNRGRLRCLLLDFCWTNSAQKIIRIISSLHVKTDEEKKRYTQRGHNLRFLTHLLGCDFVALEKCARRPGRPPPRRKGPNDEVVGKEASSPASLGPLLARLVSLQNALPKMLKL